MLASNAPADVPLQTLLDRVIRDRSALANGRHANLGPSAMDLVRAQMVNSLEAYTQALHALHLPVPYTLRDELRTQQTAHAHGTGTTPGTYQDSAASSRPDRARWAGFRDDTT